MLFRSANPFTGEFYDTFSPLSSQSLQEKLKESAEAYRLWSAVDVEHRILAVRQIAVTLRDQIPTLALLITQEMGKPITQSKAELEKCVWLVEHFCEQSPAYLDPRRREIDRMQVGVRYDPLGIILGIMPWNYPFWQVFRYAIPSLLIGNTVLLKHAPNVPRCAQAIASLFGSALPDNVFQNLFIDIPQIKEVLDYPKVQGVAVTGSVPAGQSVAALSGARIIPSVLELGSNDPFIITASAELEEAVDTFIDARFTNTGQTCIAAKRLIVEQSVMGKVREAVIDKISQLQISDPTQEQSFLSCMAREDLAAGLWEQWSRSARLAKRVWQEASRQGAFFTPGLLEGPDVSSPAWRDELFGPVAVIHEARNVAEAIFLANDTTYGLGASVWTNDEKIAQQMIAQLEFGTVSVNQKVSSDPRFPFGGIKNSGYGRELGREGFYSFSNVKTYWSPFGK